MKQVRFTEYGSPDLLQIREVEKPKPKDGEVLVKIYASSINSWDWELLNALPFVNRVMFGLFRPTKLKTLGIDIAGRVEAVGSKVNQWQAGDEVFADLSGCGWGGFAEYVAVPEDVLTMKPPNISYTQAAAVPQAGLLALQGLMDKGSIQPKSKVLINGASGGSGTFAVQIAKMFGAEITGVCCTQKMEFIRSLGVEHVIDYTQEDFTLNGQQYDLILDAHGYHSIFDYRRALAPKGNYVMHGGASSSISQIMLFGKLLSIFDNRSLGMLLHKANKGLDYMRELLEAGQVVPVIDKCFPLAEIAEAFHYYGDGNAKGKVVITIEHNDSGEELV